MGNGLLTLNEQRSHFALWALLKAPLIVSADLRRLPPASLAILTAVEVIAVNQDPLGVAGDLIWKQGPYEVCNTPTSSCNADRKFAYKAPCREWLCIKDHCNVSSLGLDHQMWTRASW